MTTLLKIRFIQLKKELSDAGPGIPLVFGLLWFMAYAAFTTYQKTPDAYYLTFFLFGFCLYMQTKRKDKSFVYKNIKNPRRVLFLEYFALTFPFSISSLLTNNWFCYPLLLIMLSLIPFLRYELRQKTYFKNISSIIPASNFEWISGFRKTFFYIIPLYALALAFSWFRIFPLILLWVISIIITSFYNECEPLQMIKASNLISEKFLKQKLFSHSKLIAIFYTPILIINTIFNFEYWEINLLFIPSQISLLCFCICLKYTNYTPSKINIANTILLSLVSLGSIIPYMVPITILMVLDYYTKAKTNLTTYLND